MDTDFSFYEKIVDGWERTETSTGVPYYVNHKTERTSWDHPYWLKIVEGLREYDNVKYAAYRTALKIRQLQKQLHLHQVELYTIRMEFEELGHTEGTWESIHCDDLLMLLVNLYRNSHDSYTTQDEPEMLADITLNLLLNLLDPNKTGFLKVMSVKFILATLSGTKLTDTYRFFYQELHDPSTYISTRILTTFLQAVMTIPDFLHESLAFGRTCEPAVASCSQMGKESGGITEDVFYRWLYKEPQTLVWLPTFHRVVTTENELLKQKMGQIEVHHEAKCVVCKTCPIIGFRYKCLKCFNFDLCQTCFFNGKTKKKHKQKHPIQEYCVNSTTKDDTAAFVKTLKNNLSRKQRRKSQLKYLPVEADSQYTNMAWSPGKDSQDPDIHCEISETARKLADLETITEEHGGPGEHHRAVLPSGQRELFTMKENLSPKDDGLQKEREELNAVIQELEAENRALYDQLVEMKDEDSDTESLTSNSIYYPTPSMKRLQQRLKETQNLPLREPLPREATPIYLSVPIIQVNGNPTELSPRTFPITRGSHSAFHQPNFSSPESCPSFSDQIPQREANMINHTPPRDRTLGDSLDELDVSPSKFSLPSPAKSHNDFLAEEAELEAIVDNVGKMFPADLSYPGNLSCRLSAGDDEMLQAANSIGAAMSEFVNTAVNIHIPQ